MIVTSSLVSSERTTSSREAEHSENSVRVENSSGKYIIADLHKPGRPALDSLSLRCSPLAFSPAPMGHSCSQLRASALAALALWDTLSPTYLLGQPPQAPRHIKGPFPGHPTPTPRAPLSPLPCFLPVIVFFFFWW